MVNENMTLMKKIYNKPTIITVATMTTGMLMNSVAHVDGQWTAPFMREMAHMIQTWGHPTMMSVLTTGNKMMTVGWTSTDFFLSITVKECMKFSFVHFFLFQTPFPI